MKIVAHIKTPKLTSTTTEPTRDYFGEVQVEGTKAEVEWWIKKAMKIGIQKARE